MKSRSNFHLRSHTLPVFNVAVQIGVAFGCAVCNIFANNRNSSVLIPFGESILPGYHDAFYACAGMAAVGMVSTLVLAPNSDARPEPLEEHLPSLAPVPEPGYLLAVVDSSDGSSLQTGVTRLSNFGGEKAEIEQDDGDHSPVTWY